ncbi:MULTISPECIES: hypothetical protein [unclassified Moorena]|uniref:hypothetical protein n=1 Tax=unclassified Moorena TaxID=2683338 RepID=UPI0013C91B02|nr:MULTISPECIES: hypothetical protein [unclassified Moorena]NEP33030.1 hypothetical protein [Moorena sp. SIO3B2]
MKIVGNLWGQFSCTDATGSLVTTPILNQQRFKPAGSLHESEANPPSPWAIRTQIGNEARRFCP